MSVLIDRMAQAWRERVRAGPRYALAALLAAVVLAGAHVARVGTPATRAVAGGVPLVILVLAALLVYRERRDWRSPQRVLQRVLAPTDGRLADRARRALRLVDRTEADGAVGSPALARLHVERLLRQASIEAIEEAASRRAQRWQSAALVLLCCAIAAALAGPVRVVEGLAVLAARDGRAPLRMSYLSYPRIMAQPPAYLRQMDRLLLFDGVAILPKGTVLTVRGSPRHEGRALVITDGEVEVPLVSDGSGGLVARYTVMRDASVRVASRFGEVLIEEAARLDVQVVPDQRPQVVLEDAPRTERLTDVDRLELRWTASDDHGLRQVDLVLRSGTREERRVLGRFDGETRYERAGHVLLARDPFLRRMFLPITVQIEARDNDPLDGPKWGRSAAVTLLPPAIGEPEAERFRALLSLRDRFVDELAWWMSRQEPTTAAERTELQQQAQKRRQQLTDQVRQVMTASHGGLGVPGGLRAFTLGQLGRLAQAGTTPSAAVRMQEAVVLALDVALRGHATRDAQEVSRRLGDVAEEAALGARLALETERRADGLERLDAAQKALEVGSTELLALGTLGRDLGSVAQADLRRVRRAREREDIFHAELAALHLAARLRRPGPSFGSAGGGGVEAGGGGAPAPRGPASEADTRFDQLAGELEQIARDHGDALQAVERALAEASERASAGSEDLRQEAAQRAEAVRRAVAGLPRPGEEPSTRRGAAALAREHAGAMAHALERLALSDAVESGRKAVSALREAERRPWDGVSDAELAEARERVERELEWVAQMRDQLERRGAQEARAALGDAAEREQELSRRAQDLARRGGDDQGALPDDVTERLERAESIMREAAGRLSSGRGAAGLELQRQAQRLLEQSRTGKTSDRQEEGDGRPPSGEDTAGKGMRTGGEVPDVDERRRAEEFRQRVLKGLGQEKSGRLAPAIQRYAEELLR